MGTPDLFGDEIAQARQALFAQARGRGGFCPCCDRFTKIYPRRYNRAIAEGLVWLYIQAEEGRGDADGFTSIGDSAPRDVVRNGGSLASNGWWGLAEGMVNKRPDTKSSGMWRITEKGRRFVQGAIKIPSHLHTYNHGIHEESARQLDISEALGRPFNYRELMAARSDGCST